MTTKQRLYRIRLFARWELCLLALLSVPNAFIFFAMPFSKQALMERVLAEGPPELTELAMYGIVITGSLAGLLIVLGYFFDFVRSLGAPTGICPPSSVISALSTCLQRQGVEPSIVSDILGKISIVPRDLSLGAHVRGIVRQRIVISGGMVPALLNGDQRALAILFHEYGHIQNWDKLLPGIVVYSIINCVLLVSIFRIPGFIFATLVYATTSYVCRRREHSADAYSVASLGSEEPLVTTICAANKISGRTFFHPSLLERTIEIDGNFPITRPSKFWLCVWPLFMGVAVIGFPLFAATQSGLFDRNYILNSSSFSFNDFSYLMPFTQFAGQVLFFIGFAGIVSELCKNAYPVFSRPKRGEHTPSTDRLKRGARPGVRDSFVKGE